MNWKLVCLSIVVLVGVEGLVPVTAEAQQTSGITGEVLDDTGGVLPGVTVTAASPALIEQQRVAISDGQGRYTFIDLRPGTYSVTFNLPGFNTVIREGIELTAGFTATVNIELDVGGIEETITVTGASPVIDVQNVRQQTTITKDLFETLPSGSKGFMSMARMIPGMSGPTDAGGASGLYSANSAHAATLHGKGSTKMSYDGMQTSNLAGTGHTSYVMNPSTAEETMVETGGISAESDASGLRINLIPKEGGNTFSGGTDFTFANQHMQSDNLTEELQARGLTATSRLLHIYDVNGTIGGPIKRDKVWFFLATRFSGNKNDAQAGVFFNKTQGTPFYTPDLDRPSFRKEWLQSQAARVTWQVSQTNKINGFVDIQQYETRGRGRNRAPEAQTCWSFWPAGVFQGTWTNTVSSRFLIEGGVSLAKNPFPCTREDVTETFDFTVKETDIHIQEASTGLEYNAARSYLYTNDMDRYVERFSVSYVTGSHSFKTGIQLQQHYNPREYVINQDLQYRFLNGLPNRITQWSTPYMMQNNTKADLGIYAQDQWAIDRLTLNYGLRFDYFNGDIPAQHVDAGRFVGERNFEPVHGVPDWKDLNPRVGVSYDLFGDGRTALKASAGRYVGKMAVTLAQSNNPVQTSINSVTRSWADANGDFNPDCDLTNFAANGECGGISNLNFGQNNPNAIQYADDLIKGYGNRDYFWDLTAEVQHELRANVSLLAGYYRNWSSHFGDIAYGWRGSTGTGVSDNLAVTPADYDPFCITAPVDPELPGGGGYEVCGLYDITPAKRGVGESVVNRPDKYGDPSRVSDFVTFSVNARLANAIELGGSLDLGRTVQDQCFVVDSPQQLLNCRIVTPVKGQTQVKVHFNMPLPGDFIVSGVFQNLSGIQYQANYNVKNNAIAPSLGRNLAACGTKVVCTASVTVPLIAPQSQFEPRRSLLDLRMSKIIRLGGGTDLRANFDIYNLFNDSSLTELNSNYGSSWRRPQGGAFTGGMVDGRLIQLGAQLTF